MNGYFNYFAVPTNNRAINSMSPGTGVACFGGGARTAGCHGSE
jgi:hypothetical protein